MAASLASAGIVAGSMALYSEWRERGWLADSCVVEKRIAEGGSGKTVWIRVEVPYWRNSRASVTRLLRNVISRSDWKSSDDVKVLVECPTVGGVHAQLWYSVSSTRPTVLSIRGEDGTVSRWEIERPEEVVNEE